MATPCHKKAIFGISVDRHPMLSCVIISYVILNHQLSTCVILMLSCVILCYPVLSFAILLSSPIHYMPQLAFMKSVPELTQKWNISFTFLNLCIEKNNFIFVILPGCSVGFPSEFGIGGLTKERLKFWFIDDKLYYIFIIKSILNKLQACWLQVLIIFIDSIFESYISWWIYLNC